MRMRAPRQNIAAAADPSRHGPCTRALAFLPDFCLRLRSIGSSIASRDFGTLQTGRELQTGRTRTTWEIQPATLAPIAFLRHRPRVSPAKMSYFYGLKKFPGPISTSTAPAGLADWNTPGAGLLLTDKQCGQWPRSSSPVCLDGRPAVWRHPDVSDPPLELGSS